MSKPFGFTGRIRSIQHALCGVWTMLYSQHNAWIHAFATFAVVGAGFWFCISNTECCIITLAIMAVWTAEALNTAFEFLADATTKEYHPLIKKSKDIAAGAVLISAFGAAIIGVIIFGPRILNL